MKSFEEFEREHGTTNQPYCKEDCRYCYYKGAAEKEKEMMEFSKWWHVAPFGLFATTEEAFEHWKKGKEGA